jgi:hypothetical protein
VPRSLVWLIQAFPLQFEGLYVVLISIMHMYILISFSLFGLITLITLPAWIDYIGLERGIEPVRYGGVLLSAPLHACTTLHNLLNVTVQIANKMGFKKKNFNTVSLLCWRLLGWSLLNHCLSNGRYLQRDYLVTAVV